MVVAVVLLGVLLLDVGYKHAVKARRWTPCSVGDRLCGRVTFGIRNLPSNNKMCMVCVTAVHLWCHTWSTSADLPVLRTAFPLAVTRAQNSLSLYMNVTRSWVGLCRGCRKNCLLIVFRNWLVSSESRILPRLQRKLAELRWLASFCGAWGSTALLVGRSRDRFAVVSLGFFFLWLP